MVCNKNIIFSLSMYLIKSRVIKEYGGMGVQLHAFLTAAPDAGQL